MPTHRRSRRVNLVFERRPGGMLLRAVSAVAALCGTRRFWCMSAVRNGTPSRLKGCDQGRRRMMNNDHDQVGLLFAQIASEQDVIDQLAASAQRLQAIQQAKRDLAQLDSASLRRAIARRHAALEASA
jgi:hypothetical protein